MVWARGGLASKVEQLLEAARRGDIYALRRVMTGPERPPVDAPDPVTLRTPLIEAVGLGHAPVVQSLLTRRANVDLKDSEGCTALMFAASSGSSQIVGWLLRRNPRVNAQDKDGWTALMHAASGNYRFMVKALLGHPKLDRQIKNHHGQTASDLTTCLTIKSLLNVSGCRWSPALTPPPFPQRARPEPPPLRACFPQDAPPVTNGPAPSAPPAFGAPSDPSPPPPPPQAQVGGAHWTFPAERATLCDVVSMGLARRPGEGSMPRCVTRNLTSPGTNPLRIRIGPCVATKQQPSGLRPSIGLVTYRPSGAVDRASKTRTDSSLACAQTPTRKRNRT
jgi:hypothetical protein